MFNEVSKQGFCLLYKTLNEVLNEVSMKFENKVAVIRASAFITLKFNRITAKHLS